MGKKKNRILRFAVTGALLAGTPALAACGGGGEATHTNEPAPTHTNEPAPEETVNEPATAGDEDMGDETVNEVEPEPETNEPAPE